MQAELGKMFEVRCPRALGEPASKTLHYSFESGGLPSPMHKGTITSGMEAFCGKKSVMNPTFLYYDKNSRISLGQNVKTVSADCCSDSVCQRFWITELLKNSKGMISDEF